MENRSQFRPYIYGLERPPSSPVKMLYENNIMRNNFVFQDPNGNIPLHTACSDGNDGLVDLLLNEEDVAIANRDGHFGIHLAIAKGHFEYILHFLSIFSLFLYFFLPYFHVLDFWMVVHPIRWPW